MSVEERFGWKTKREIRLDLLRQTLDELNDNAVEELDKAMYQRDVKAARVFMDAFRKAREDDKNAYSEANIALQQAGFPRTNSLVSGSMPKRERQIREIDEALLKRFEEKMIDEEREQ